MYTEAWKYDNLEVYDEWVGEKQAITSYGPLGALGRNGWYIQDYALDIFPSIAGYDIAGSNSRQNSDHQFSGFKVTLQISWAARQ